MNHPRAFDSLAMYQRRGGEFSLLNMVVLAAVFVLHVSYVQLLGPPRMLLMVVLAALFALQFAIYAWLQGLRALPSTAMDRTVFIGSICITILGAFFASMYGEGEDHHYYVLMLPAIVLAAFRFGRTGALTTAAVASALTYYDVWRWFEAHPPAEPSEFFEAATVGLVFLVVALVVQVLAHDLRRRSVELSLSLADLERTRDGLVAQEKLAAVGRLSSAIAHEIRNPVAMIHSSLAASARGGLDESAREQMFRVAMEESGRLERLTSDFLAYAHTRVPQRARTEVDETLAVVAELVAARAAEAGVHVEREPSGASGVFDPFMLHQALLNLAMNAAEAAPAAGTVRLGGRREGEALVLWVENDGPPVPPETVARVFEPFFTTKAGGTGLGLAIAMGIARSHGGEARLERNERDHVRFALVLPDAGATAGEKR